MVAKDKIKIVKSERHDDYFSDLVVSTGGEDEAFRYAKQALKTQVEQLLISYMSKGSGLIINVRSVFVKKSHSVSDLVE